MNRRPRFSAIIIFHNQEGFVRTAVESALAQGIDDLEIIAVDDASTDGTREALSEYQDLVRLVFLDENQGMCGARDAGTAVATGDYLAYLDGDDAFLPWAIDTYRRVAELENPVLMMGPMHWFEGLLPDSGPAPERLRYVVYDDYFAKDKVVDISASAIVVRRDAIGSLDGWGGDGVGDLDLLYRLGTTGPFAQVIEPSTTWHRSHEGQMIRQAGAIVSGVEWIIANDKQGRYPGGDARRFERRACIGGIVLHWARMHAAMGARGAALKFVLASGPYVGSAVVMRALRLIRGRKSPQTESLPTSVIAVREADRLDQDQLVHA